MLLSIEEKFEVCKDFFVENLCMKIAIKVKKKKRRIVFNALELHVCNTRICIKTQKQFLMAINLWHFVDIQAARRELERQRQMEWERQRKEQLLSEKAREYEQLGSIKSRASNLKCELESQVCFA